MTTPEIIIADGVATGTFGKIATPGMNTHGSVPILLNCPSCGERHIDEGIWSTKAHHNHACQHCGMVWRPAIIATVGVRFLPGFKNGEES